MGKLACAVLMLSLLIGPVQNGLAQSSATHPQNSSPAATPSAPTAAVPAAPTPPPAADTADKPPPGGGYSRLFGLIFGLIVAGGVVWIIRRLVRNRGELLLDMARKAGVEVPNLDDPIPLAATASSPEYKPKPPIEKIPDEATRPAVIPPSRPHSVVSRVHTGESRIVAIEGVASGSTFAISGEIMSIGRDGDNDLVLADPTVSRRHAIITKDPKGAITIADGGSSNGIVINGERVDNALLSPGDEIKIGDNYFRFEGS